MYHSVKNYWHVQLVIFVRIHVCNSKAACSIDKRKFVDDVVVSTVSVCYDMRWAKNMLMKFSITLVPILVMVCGDAQMNTAVTALNGASMAVNHSWKPSCFTLLFCTQRSLARNYHWMLKSGLIDDLHFSFAFFLFASRILLCMDSISHSQH